MNMKSALRRQFLIVFIERFNGTIKCILPIFAVSDLFVNLHGKQAQKPLSSHASASTINEI